MDVDELNRIRKRKKRKVRWGRMLVFFLGMVIFCASFIFGAVYAYHNFIVKPDETVKKNTFNNNDLQTNENLTGLTNILILGEDDGEYGNIYETSKRSDSILLLSINPMSKKVHLLSIPRDTYTEIPGKKDLDKIGHAYAYGGPYLTMRTVSNLLNMPIDYYVALDWQGFIKAIDILGGVNIYVDKDLKYEDPYANLSIDIKQGYQHLDGKAAGGYVRFRNDDLADIGRMQRQQKFFTALGDEIFKPSTLFKIPSLWQTVKSYIKTDMELMTILKTLNSLKNVVLEHRIENKILPGKGIMINNVSYWQVDSEKMETMLKEF